jgi:MoCo/4Fe-4S cofactor protein with predicted Tat translocation signal
VSHAASPISNSPGADNTLRYWRSLEELQDDAQFTAALEREFPRLASFWDSRTMDRRHFLQLAAATIALGTMTGCNETPTEPIMPYVRAPEQLVAGIANHFATAMPRSGGAIGLVVTSQMGRPIKIEGNPQHSASLGATDAAAQASILTLYDPERLQTVLHRGEISTWGEVRSGNRRFLESTMSPRGAGLHVLSEPITSPTLARQRRELLEKYPEARWHQYEPCHRDHERAGALLAFGRDVQAVYHFDRAERVLVLDSDIFCQEGGGVRYAHDFMTRRMPRDDAPANRLYVLESGVTSTGSAADHRWPLSPRQIELAVRHLASRLTNHSVSNSEAFAAPWIAAVANDLREHRGKCLVVPGQHLSAEIHALCHAMNDALGNIGQTIDLIEPLQEESRGALESLRDMTTELNAGRVEMLLILGGNPVYASPAGLNFAQALPRAKETLHLTLYANETSELCRWNIPAAHYLESWNDAQAYDGTTSIIQPLIAPLYGGKTPQEVVSLFLEEGPLSSKELLQATWQETWGEAFPTRWHEALSTGVITDTESKPVEVSLREGINSAAPDTGAQEFELRLIVDPTIGDGTWTNNAWLQELPKPLTKLTWENALLLSPREAEQRELETGSVVAIETVGQALEVPVLIAPGHTDGCGTLSFGYGRWRAGPVGTGHGVDAYRLWPSDGSYRVSVTLRKTGRSQALARTQQHHAIDGRNIVHAGTVEQYQQNPLQVLHPAEMSHDVKKHEEHSFYPKDEYPGFAWGMAIDLTRCMGCNACVVACQAENNIPVVGREGVLRSREMHWLRIDTYFSGEPENPEVIQQPMLCQHCEKAPCEVVCPVAATTHSSEGLNEMTYNRCVGTRYCSNNCPYKVRRFNFLQYQDAETPVLELLRNPDVTVRSRGVMEKCTYCVQRINHARIDAKKEAIVQGQPPMISDGSLQTACQQACPAQAIVFGNINDPEAQVTQLKAEARNYGVLSELGTIPRTTYLAKLRNPNPRIV